MTPTLTTWTATIPGSPVAKGRPRATVIGGHARMYTPSSTAKWEGFACVVLTTAWGSRPRVTGPVELHVLALFERPKRLLTKRAIGAMVPHTTKPDADNLGKASADAVEKAGIVANDSQAWRVTVEKRYVLGDERPGVTVRLSWEES